jgi:hypothetical protein
MHPKEHANLLGLFFWISAGLQIFLVVVVGVIYFFMFGLAAISISQEGGKDAEEAAAAIIVLAIFVIFVMLFFTALFLIPRIVAGYGLRRDKSWAQVWTIIACVLSILNIPLGTAVGIYGLWFVFSDQGKYYFAHQQFLNAGQNPAQRYAPPPPNYNYQQNWR